MAEDRQQRWDNKADSPDLAGPGAPSSDGFEPRAVELAPMSIRRTAGTVVAEKFALQRVIASGGMGTVFEAWDTYIERKVALKIMHPQYASDPALVARFRREAQAAARIQHPNVVNVLELGRQRDGLVYLVQELLVGETLRAHLEERSFLPPDDALAIAIPLMNGLAAAHSLGITHRDLKPENIILARMPSGEIIPKIIDFGLAKLQDVSKQSLTSMGTVLGTPQYMSPEQVMGKKVDARADIWAMGVVVYEMLSGILPFDGDSIADTLALITDGPLPPLDIVASRHAAPYASVVAKAMQKALNDRYGSIVAFRDALCDVGGTARVLVARASSLLSPNGGPLPGGVPADGDPVLDESPPDLDDLPPLPMTSSRKNLPKLLTPLPDSQAEWAPRPVSVRKPQEDHLKLAEEALAVNALKDAIHSAKLAIAKKDDDEDARGRAWLVATVAHRWLGNYTEALLAAEEAMVRSARGETIWHAAFGHEVMAYGYMGRKDRLLQCVDELSALEEEEGISTEAHIVSACRLAVFVIRAGVTQLGKKIAREAHARIPNRTAAGPLVRAWLACARAEIALTEGDAAAYLRRSEAAVDAFTEAADVRNACLSRTTVGDAYMLLGGYDRASFVLRRAIEIAEPMLLDFTPLAKSMLAYCSMRMGHPGESWKLIDEALEMCRSRQDKLREAEVLATAARMRMQKREPTVAITLARSALSLMDPDETTGKRALALAVLADALLEQGQVPGALSLAQEAAAILDRVGGLQSSESLVRTVHALALIANGQESEGCRRLNDARNGLLATARKVTDTRFKRSFLDASPDHERLLDAAAEWCGPG
ncbi:MAG TPA: serine/threonine-protein kinase [Polyangium sp.]|nr:serine/threonine-protein kinase [Polyangium sp.]